ncbi:hypothetical protein Lal_00013960 [Lupinus albus]|uniref:Putative transcription factor interactor and regulator CCHC(Zn) family n=1 Tax=Lupinus albus TaxID=3870 RepID=A0A6A5LFK0_LUPAL|nr:putative transcription factor interactor and regulator CCHC(Zn) family [Lupinus albus]KAF1861234.1 hypothetical protein Lal_00013960 [Lupinus albus]
MSEEKIKPKTDSELFQSYTNQCVWKNLENGSCAGANAASLSEIVYSQDKGLSLKCADSSFTHKNNSLFWDVGPNSTVLPPPQSLTGIMPQGEGNEVNDTGSGGNNMEKMNTAERALHDQHDNLINDSGKNTCDVANIETDKIFGIEGNNFSTIPGQVDQMPFGNLLFQSDKHEHSMEQNPSPKKCSNEGMDIGKGKKAVVIDDALYATFEPIIECKGSGAAETNLASTSRNPLEKLESTADNDLQTSNIEAVCAATSGIIVKEIRNKSQNNEMMLPCDKILPLSHYPCHSRIHMITNEGKEKSLSDGDAKVRLSKEENDSNSSVESCNSTGSFSTGKKRRNFSQKLIIGSKRVKKQVEENFDSKSYVKRDSSFMNWISNVVKGLPQSMQDVPNTSAHTLSNPDPDDRLITCKTNQDLEPKSTGFKSLFQSIYCPSLKNSGTGKYHQEGKVCDDIKPDYTVSGIEATPITCCEVNNSLYRQYLQSNRFEVSAERYEAGPSPQPMIKPLDFLNIHESTKDKEEMGSHSSSTRQNTNNMENVDSIALYDRREAGNVHHKSDNTLGNLWITRFSPKTTSPLIISDHLNEKVGSQVQATGSSKIPNNSNKHISYLRNCKVEQTREQSGDEMDVSAGLKDDKGNNNHKLKNKFNPLSSSTGFRNSKPMTPMFGRRLGSIKHSIPVSRTDSTTQVNTLCLFCGTRGHQLGDCSSIEESELKNLQENINLHGELEELPCICIKCFQPNHWAISCHSSTFTRKQKFEVNALFNYHIPSGERISPSNERSTRLLTSEEDQILSGSCNIDGTDHKEERNLNLMRKSNQAITSKVGCYASFKKYCSASSKENKFKEDPGTSPSKLAERQVSQVPQRISDAVKRLRLSRTDILKWINTHGSISQLDGFYLRLRLGTWEEGLRGTRYHVASINVDAERQSSEQSTTKSLLVNVRGIKYMLESRYISNHDFLEEEIMEWWSTTTEVGAEEDLNKRIEKKIMLDL